MSFGSPFEFIVWSFAEGLAFAGGVYVLGWFFGAGRSMFAKMMGGDDAPTSR